MYTEGARGARPSKTEHPAVPRRSRECNLPIPNLQAAKILQQRVFATCLPRFCRNTARRLSAVRLILVLTLPFWGSSARASRVRFLFLWPFPGRAPNPFKGAPMLLGNDDGALRDLRLESWNLTAGQMTGSGTPRVSMITYLMVPCS